MQYDRLGDTEISLGKRVWNDSAENILRGIQLTQSACLHISPSQNHDVLPFNLQVEIIKLHTIAPAAMSDDESEGSSSSEETSPSWSASPAEI